MLRPTFKRVNLIRRHPTPESTNGGTNPKNTKTPWRETSLPTVMQVTSRAHI